MSITDRIAELNINFADDQSRKNYFSFTQAARESVGYTPLLILSGIPESRKLQAARLALGLCADSAEAIESDGAAFELGPDDNLCIIDVDLLTDADDLAEAAEFVRRAATLGEGEPPRFVAVLAAAWFPLPAEHEARALRVNLRPAALVAAGS